VNKKLIIILRLETMDTCKQFNNKWVNCW